MIVSKICNTCGIEKSINQFKKAKSCKDGYMNKCKDCLAKDDLAKRRTIDGVIQQMYNSQIQASKKRGHSLPQYTKEELKQWLFNDTDFVTKYNDWVNSNYNKNKKPSVDRINPNKGYTLDNIQLLTWENNKRKGHLDIKNGIDNRRNKKVYCYDMDGVFVKEFYSVSETARQLQLSQGNITHCLDNETRSYRGYRFTSVKYKKLKPLNLDKIILFAYRNVKEQGVKNMKKNKRKLHG